MTHENRFAFQEQIGVPAEEWGWLRQWSRLDKQSGFLRIDALVCIHTYIHTYVYREMLHVQIYIQRHQGVTRNLTRCKKSELPV